MDDTARMRTSQRVYLRTYYLATQTADITTWMSTIYYAQSKVRYRFSDLPISKW